MMAAHPENEDSRIMTIVIKAIILILFVFIFFSLGSALYYLMRDKEQFRCMVKALSWRIGLSILLFVILMLAFYGLDHPIPLNEELRWVSKFRFLIDYFHILMMVFGTQRLRDIGNDLAVAIRNFHKGLKKFRRKT